MVFRTNFVIFWLIANSLYYIMIVEFIEHESGDGSFGYLEIFSLVLAGLVVFRFLFSTIYILGWKFRYTCSANYKIEEQDLKQVYKQIQKEAKEYGGESSDDGIIEAKVEKFYT